MSDVNREKFFETLERSLAEGGLVKLTLAKYRGPEPDLRNVYVRPLRVKRGERLSFLYRYETRDVVKNHADAEGLALVRELLGAEFLSGHLFTTRGDLRIEFNRRREARLAEGAPTLAGGPRDAGHERRKRRHVEPEGNVYLRALGVTDERGRVRPAMGDKFRQIDKFVETVAHALAASPLAGKAEISVLDVGSGKGYLTFAVHDYLTNGLGLKARTVGVEARPELVELCNRVAGEAGFGGLSFEAGDIHDFEARDADILIALHACDTATDEAIHKGVAAGASVIITAPCCHKELRPQIRPPAPLRGLLRHGIMLGREAEMVTDSLRALLLEHAGYSTRVFEFVPLEHTPKNTLIVGVRRGRGGDPEAALRQFQTLKEFYGIGEQRLEHLLLHGGGACAAE